MRTKKIIKAWGGFVDGKLHTWHDTPHAIDKHLAVYGSRKRAQRLYDDVRRIEIVVTVGK